MDKQYIISEIRRTAAANGGVALGQGRFSTETDIRIRDWKGKWWARWGDALRDAGFAPNEKTIAYPDDYLIEKLVSLIRELGHFPVFEELRLKARRDSRFPSDKPFERLGSKDQRIKRILEYCSGRPEYMDIAAICAPVAETQEILASKPPADPEPPVGFVYLIKAGRYYKIGRTNALGRRERELAIQLPEKANTVHSIRTDDPAGIEEYWHRRFAKSRVRQDAEWFDLKAADLQAFKRRRSM